LQNDYMLILEGPQGGQKSTACAILAGAFFSDGMPDVRSGGKDVSRHLRGKWLIEVAEMSAMDKAESAALKAFITRREERYRPPYGRKEVVEPRQCVFIGTTNAAVYLRDPSSGRRFWPVTVGEIDIEALTRNRDQLFAEAVHLYVKLVPWWPEPRFEREHMQPEQGARYEADAWEETIGKWLTTPEKCSISKADPFTTVEMERVEITISEVAEKALGLGLAVLGTSQQRRISACLERLGWVRGARTLGRRPWVRRHDA
jgi:predicted P-loop ATPase